MNKMVQKLIAFILSLVICASCVLNMSVSAESASTIWYGDQLAVDVTAGIDGYTFMSLFRKPASGYEFGGHFLANSSTQEGAQTFVVIDTVAHNGTTWSPNGRYEPHRSNYDVTYCCDINTMMRDGTYYKRLNLEDSEYFNDAQAAKIRAIVTNSYPYVMLEAMKENLAEGGFENADKLTRGEIISAVQTAIWACANSMETLKYVQSYRVTDNYQWGQPLHDISDEADLDVAGNRVFKAYPEVGTRIDALVEYLLAQDADYASKAQVVITELKIKDEPAILDEENQIYRVPLSLIMNNSGSGYEDNINIRVTAGKSEIVIPVVYGQNTYTIEVAAKPGDVIKAVVSGTQVLPKGVYFYAPKPSDINGDGVATAREVSQNMVGVAMGRTEVYAEDSVAFEELEIHVPVHTRGSVIVTKNTSGATTPADATFQLQKMEGDEWINVGEPVAYSAFVENAYTFTELEEGTYRVVESGAEIEEFRLETTYGENVVLTKTTTENGDTSVSSGSALVTNIYTPYIHTPGSITVNKIATGAATPAGATFQLQKLNGNDWVNIGEAVAFSSFANNAYNFTGLEEGTYRIVESGAEVDGYTLEATYSDNVVLTKTTAENGDTSVNSGEFFVTNTYEPEDIIEIPDDDVPLTDVPQTGDPILQYVGLAITSGVAAILVGKTGKKKEDEE